MNMADDGLANGFRAAGSTDWRLLSVASDASEAEKKDVKSSKDELSAMLLSSLQMQHLVVLAGSGCSLAAGGPSMGALWTEAIGEIPSAVATKSAGRVHHDLSDHNIETFLSRIEALLQLEADTEVSNFLNDCKKVILEKCSSFLATSKVEAHQVFLHRLSRRRVRDQRLKIFTTNYDLCFERAASYLGSVALDGFSFATPRRYDPRFFSYDIVRRPRSGDDLGSYLEGVFLLYKLHGSVNWARIKGNEIVEKETPSAEEACLIYPARGKYRQSFTQPHLESMAQYLSALREPNTCVLVVGFGFNDDHLSEPLLAAARSNPHLRIVIVDPFAEEQIKARKEYWTQLSELAATGVDIWFVESNFDDFAEMIPDLRSLTPGDALMKAVKNAATA